METVQPQVSPAAAVEEMEVEAGSRLASSSGIASDPATWNFSELLDETLQSAEFYCAEGFAAFDEALSQSAGFPEKDLTTALEGSLHLFRKTLTKVRQEMASFQEETLSSSLHVPLSLLHPMSQPGTLPHSRQDVPSKDAESQLDMQLAAARRGIAQANSQTQAFNLTTAGIQRQLAEYGDSTPLEKVVSPLRNGKENLAEDAAAIAAKAAELEPLLRFADDVFTKHQAHKSTGGPNAIAAEKEAAGLRARVIGDSEVVQQIALHFE